MKKITDDKILYGNNLIAKYMNLDVLYDCMVHHKSVHPMQVTKMRYHESWDWLMEVVEKIEQLGFNTEMYGWFLSKGFVTNFSIWKHRTDMSTETERITCKESVSKIEAVWFAIVEFLEWYNKQGVK